MASVSSDALPESFSKAFERLRATVNTEDARTFASTTMEDVWNTARRIERQLEAKRSLRNFNRIQKFLAGIEQYSKTVEVLCNQTPYLPFVWAPIKLFLDIAQANLFALDKLIDAYAMIGEAMPRFDRLSAAFKDDQDFQQVLGQFYEDILEFHRRAYKFFRRRAWKIVFESLWKTFNLRFEFILESLRKHRDLIDQEANAIDIVEAKAWRSKQLEEVQRRHMERAEDLDRVEGERLSRQIREAVAWLGANEEQEDTLAKLLRVHDSKASHWSLTKPIILSWIEQSRENSYIWLNGKPGAGKSVICSKIIEHIQEKTEMVILFYFCHHFQTSKEPISEVLKCFATQMLVANPGLAPYILDTFANAGRKPTKKYLAEILEKLIASSRPIRVLVDGLDEWSQIDQEDLVKDLIRIRGPSPGACKILFSSRKTAHLTKLLQSQPNFRLDDYGENITSNIASFVQERLTRLRQTFASELIDELEGEILKRADGMFLWVRLILHTLEGLYYESDVRETIKTLPNDLDALYERILSRICGNGRDPNARRTVRILQWMLVAQRPLRQAELESGIILDDQVQRLTPATRARGNVLSLCFPLIEIDEESDGYVHFCHFTALEFLQKSNTYAVLQPTQAHVTVSLSCVLYLVSSLQFVDPSVPERDVRDQVIQRFHELLLYACDHWLDHLQALADTPTRLLAEQDTLSSLQQGLESLSHSHTELVSSKGWICRQQTDAFPSSRDGLWGSLGVSPSVCRLLNQGLMSKDQVSAVASARPGQHTQSDGYRDSTLFTSIRACYKTITEEILNPQNPADALMREFRVSHSSGYYLCSYQSCPRASQGFSSTELRQQHEESHAPRFQCPNPACVFWKCSSEAALRKHTIKYHDAQDVSDVPSSIHRSVREVPQERSLFRLSTPRVSSPKEDHPTYKSLAREGSSKGTTPQYVPHIANGVPTEPPSFQYLRNSSGHLLQLPTSALRPPQSQAAQDYELQLFLLDAQYERRLQMHQDPTGWQATIGWQERLANYQQIVSHGIDPKAAKEYERTEFQIALNRETYDAAFGIIDIPPNAGKLTLPEKNLAQMAMQQQQQQQQQQQTINNDMGYKYTQPLIQDQPNPPLTKTGGQSTTSSYWSVPEQKDMCNYLAHFGPNWQAIAQIMKTKTHTMIKNFYNRQVAEGGEFGRLLEETAQRAEMKIRNGQDTGPLPAPKQQQQQQQPNIATMPDNGNPSTSKTEFLTGRGISLSPDLQAAQKSPSSQAWQARIQQMEQQQQHAQQQRLQQQQRQHPQLDYLTRPFPDSPPLDYEAARERISREHSENLLGSRNFYFAPTTSIAGAPDTLTGVAPTSVALRTGEVSGGVFNSNPDHSSNRRPVANAFENGMDLPELPRPSDLGSKENPEIPWIDSSMQAIYSSLQLTAAEQRKIDEIADRMVQNMSTVEKINILKSIPRQKYEDMVARGMNPIHTWCHGQIARRVLNEKEESQRNSEEPTLPESTRPNYQEARTSIEREHSKNLRLDLSQFPATSAYRTSSMPDGLGLSAHSAPISDAVETAEVSGEFSNGNLNPQSYPWPATNGFENGMGLGTPTIQVRDLVSETKENEEVGFGGRRYMGLPDGDNLYIDLNHWLDSDEDPNVHRTSKFVL